MKYKIRKYLDGNGKAVYVPMRKDFIFWTTFSTMSSSFGDFGTAEFDSWKEASDYINRFDASVKSCERNEVCDLDVKK